MAGDLCKKKNRFGGSINAWTKEKKGFKCQARIASQRGSVSSRNTKKGEEDEDPFFQVLLFLQKRHCHTHPRPLRLLLLSVPLVREAGETKKEVRWALDLSARVFRALMHCWKCQSSEDWWRDYKTLFVPNLPCHCWRSWCVRANEAFLLLPLGCCGDGKHFFFLAVFMDGRVWGFGCFPRRALLSNLM